MKGFSVENSRDMYVNGHKLHYVTFGKGKDIIFLHGWGASISAFLFVAKNLCYDYRVTVLDFAGFGASEEPAVPYGVEDYAKDVICLMDRLHIESATFVGHSFGGRVAVWMGSRFPDRTQRLVLVDSAGLKPRRKPVYYIKVFAHKVLKKLGKKGLKGSSDYQILSPVMKQTFIKVVNCDQTSQLKDIVCPTAVFWGKNDKDTPLYMFAKFKKRIAGAQSFLLDGGHFSYVDDSVRFMLILRAYLKETDRCLDGR